MARPYTFPITRRAGYRFDGVDDYIMLPDLSETPNGAVAIWFRLGVDVSYSDYVGLMTNRAQGTPTLSVGFTGTGYFEFAMHDGVWRIAKTTQLQPFMDRWCMIAGTWKQGSYVKLFVDGEEVGSDTMGTFTVKDGNWAVGGSVVGYTPKPFHGIISEACIYNQTLSSTEIRRLYEGRAAPNDVDGCVLWLPLYEGHTRDRSGSGNHGVNHGAIYTVG